MYWGGDGNQFGGGQSSGFNSPGAGGGFMDRTFGESPSLSQEKRDKRNLATVPVTIAAIVNSTYDSTADACSLEGVILHQVTLVGMVSSIQENPTNLSYEIDDLTAGTITVKKWVDQMENSEEYEKVKFREDTYVRIYGFIKVLNDGRKSISAFNIRRVTDFNEITYHMLDVIHSHLVLKKALEETSLNSSTNQFGSNAFSGQREGFGGGNEDSMGLSKPQYKVLELISSTTAPEGLGIPEIMRRSNFNEPTTRKILEFLSDEGHIYSTTDEEHFRSTNG